MSKQMTTQKLMMKWWSHASCHTFPLAEKALIWITLQGVKLQGVDPALQVGWWTCRASESCSCDFDKEEVSIDEKKRKQNCDYEGFLSRRRWSLRQACDNSNWLINLASPGVKVSNKYWALVQALAMSILTSSFLLLVQIQSSCSSQPAMLNFCHSEFMAVWLFLSSRAGRAQHNYILLLNFSLLAARGVMWYFFDGLPW